jgi:uncharacterized membrane protein YkvA (DUF1232 family)
VKNQFFNQVLQNGVRKALRNPKYRGLALIAALFYLVSPLDIIPDTIPIIGWIDDGVIASIVIGEVSQIVLEQMKNRKKNNYNENEVEFSQQQANAVVDVEAVTVN